jgi:hypothetical protein
VARLKGTFYWNMLPLFVVNLPSICYFGIFQMKNWTSHIKYHVYCIWILSKEVIRVSKLLFKGIFDFLKFTCFCFLTDLACFSKLCHAMKLLIPFFVIPYLFILLSSYAVAPMCNFIFKYLASYVLKGQNHSCACM